MIRRWLRAWLGIEHLEDAHNISLNIHRLRINTANDRITRLADRVNELKRRSGPPDPDVDSLVEFHRDGGSTVKVIEDHPQTTEG